MMRVLLWLNSNAPSRKLISQLADDVDIVAGVDGGYDRALECGFVPDMVIGDLDSVQSSCEGIQRVPIPDQESSDLVKMVHEDGRKADVHPSMVEAYKSGGYTEV